MVRGSGQTAGMRQQKRRGRAFTLVELLIVIAVIGILASIMVPWLARARDSARIASCGSNLHQIVNSLFCYARNNERLMLPCSLAGSTSHDDMSLLVPQYAPDINVFRCPASQYDFPTEREHINYKTSLRHIYGDRAQLSYEYPGEYRITLRRRVDPKLAFLVYDDDGRGANKQTDLDAHAPYGGNMSFIDGRVTWIDADEWPYYSMAGLYAWKDPPQKYPKPP